MTITPAVVLVPAAGAAYVVQSQSAGSMDKDVSLWALGILCTVIGGLLILLVNRVLKQGDDTQRDVREVKDGQGRQSVAIAKIETTLHGEGGLAQKVNRLTDERNKAHDRELETAIEEAVTLRRENDALRNAGPRALKA